MGRYKKESLLNIVIVVEEMFLSVPGFMSIEFLILTTS